MIVPKGPGQLAPASVWGNVRKHTLPSPEGTMARSWHASSPPSLRDNARKLSPHAYPRFRFNCWFVPNWTAPLWVESSRDKPLPIRRLTASRRRTLPARRARLRLAVKQCTHTNLCMLSCLKVRCPTTLHGYPPTRGDYATRSTDLEACFRRCGVSESTRPPRVTAVICPLACRFCTRVRMRSSVE